MQVEEISAVITNNTVLFPRFTLLLSVHMLHSIGLGNLYLRVSLPSRKYRSIEVGNLIFPSGKLWILRAPPTSDSEIRIGKYEFPSPM